MTFFCGGSSGFGRIRPFFELDPIGWMRTSASETHGQAAQHSLRRSDDEQFVVDGRVGGSLAEAVPHGKEHFPSGGTEVHEWERLMDLEVETRVIRGPVGASRAVVTEAADE